MAYFPYRKVDSGGLAKMNVHKGPGQDGNSGQEFSSLAAMTEAMTGAGGPNGYQTNTAGRPTNGYNVYG